QRQACRRLRRPLCAGGRRQARSAAGRVMASRFNLACIQITATEDVAGNIEPTPRLIREARAAGADLISTPENPGIMAARGEETRAAAKPEAEHPALLAYRAL